MAIFLLDCNDNYVREGETARRFASLDERKGSFEVSVPSPSDPKLILYDEEE